MKLEIFRSLWGASEPARTVIQQVRDSAVYDGIEAVLPRDAGERRELHDDVVAAGVGLVALIDIPSAEPAQQLEMYRAELRDAAECDPVRIVAHVGCDHWPPDVALEFFQTVLSIERDLGVSAAHETHRGRPTFTPWSTVRLLDELPELNICCDLSHWVVVCERFLEDQEAAVARVAGSTTHIHARVGNAEAIQEGSPAVAQQREPYETWWSRVWDAQARQEHTLTTLTPEYGPPPYQPVDPRSGSPMVPLDEVCEWEALRCRELFASWSASQDRPSATTEG